MSAQNYHNHSRLVPLYHYGVFSALLIVLAGSIRHWIHAVQAGSSAYPASLLVLLCLATILGVFYGRYFALRAQDRAIRAEMQFRHYLATGKPLDPSLRMGQIIALRFAGDDEFVALCERAAREQLAPKVIKESIQNWKPDYHRV